MHCWKTAAGSSLAKEVRYSGPLPPAGAVKEQSAAQAEKGCISWTADIAHESILKMALLLTANMIQSR